MRCIIGIDPGLEGGIAIISHDGVGLHQMPKISYKSGKKNKRELDEAALVRLFTDIAMLRPRPLILLEKVASRPGQGVSSMFSFGAGWGLIRGIMAGMGLAYELVTPQQWKKVAMEGQTPGSEALVASRLWPETVFRPKGCRVHHMGLVDAALIAEYGRRRAQPI